MRRSFLVLLLLATSTANCRSAPAPEPAETLPPQAESRATAMPEKLLCRSAGDCVPEPTCYWAAPACVAEASMVVPVCGSDADPPDKSREPVTCGCSGGQCVPL